MTVMVTILTAWQLVNGNKSSLSRYPSHRLENVFFEQDASASAAFLFPSSTACSQVFKGCQSWDIIQVTEFCQHKDREKSNIKKKNKTGFFFLTPDWLILLSEDWSASLSMKEERNVPLIFLNVTGTLCFLLTLSWGERRKKGGTDRGG